MMCRKKNDKDLEQFYIAVYPPPRGAPHTVHSPHHIAQREARQPLAREGEYKPLDA